MKLHIVEPPDDTVGGGYWALPAGAMWRCPFDDHNAVEGRGPCWIIRLPGTAHVWHTNRKATREGGDYWTVTGEAPNLTVTPSINVGPEIWHGWITNGELSPDTDSEGRP